MSITATRTQNIGSSLSQIDQMLAKAKDASRRRKEVQESPKAAQVAETVPAADDVDQAYGLTMNLLGNSMFGQQQNAPRTGHALDPERVAKLLEL